MPPDFTSLSPQDFEELVRDLLQAEWRVAIEAFKTGRDSGIDLRYVSTNDGVTIVQCKHYVRSGYGKLLAHLRNVELAKVNHLRPSRYVVVTSQGLTPANKDEIVAAMHPFIKGTRDVLGAQDLEGLLRRHPSVEKANFKLWLTSTAVLERVLHNAVQSHTDFAVDRIRHKLPLFVQSNAFPRARVLLEENQVVVICGTPGIGKTTLAELLLYAHLEQGYQAIVIQGDIADGRRLFRPGARQIFYYDDFLGQTFLGDRKDYLGRNEDMALVDFVRMIQSTEYSRFILTTREHILRNALQLSERFGRSLLFEDRCVIQLEDYSFAHRARILYNHLYFSDLPQPYRDAMLEENFFLDVIRHEHFNPRVIEWLASYVRLKHVTPEGYRKYVSALLSSPESIWSHAFENQISNAARNVLLALYTLGSDAAIFDLEPAFGALHRHRSEKYNQQIRAGDFDRALAELDGSFLLYKGLRVDFLNPSVREFVGSTIGRDRDTAEDVLLSTVKFRQVVGLSNLAQVDGRGVLSTVLRDNEDLLFDVLMPLLRGPVTERIELGDGAWGTREVDMSIEERIEFLAAVSTARCSERFVELAMAGAEQLAEKWDKEIPDFGAVCRLLRKIGRNTWFLSHGGANAYRTLSDGVLDKLDAAWAEDWLKLIKLASSAQDWRECDEERLDKGLDAYCRSGVYDEISSYSNVDEMAELAESLRQLSEDHGLELSRAIESLQENIDERGESTDEGYMRGSGAPSGNTASDTMSDDDVIEMFTTLRDLESS